MVDPIKKDELPASEEVKDMDDKSINELLKEYAEDVKDKDLDEFLQDSGEDDAFEGDDGDDAPVAAQKKSGGLLTFALFLIIAGAAGAGAWMYFNKNEGMTNVMGGFSGEPVAANMDTPPTPEATPSMPAPTTDTAAAAPAIESPFPAEMTAPDATASAADVPAPTPILNETNSTEAAAPAADTTAAVPAMDAPVAAEAAAPEAVVPAEAKSAPAESTSAEAVDNWVASASDGMAETDAKLGAAPAASEPATPVDATPAKEVKELKAKPVSVKSEDKAEATVADAPKKAARASSPYDDALPPPYVGIKAGKGGSTTSAATTTASASAAKMAPVVEGGSSEPYLGKTGSTASSEPSETRATGIYKDLVKQGGGSIDLPGLTANVQNDITVGNTGPVVPAANPAVSAPVDNGPRELAIKGGRSLPETMTVRTSPTTTVTAKLPQQLDNPQMDAVPVEPVRTEAPVAQPQAVAPAAPAPSASDAAPTGDTIGQLKAVLNEAIAAEKAGDATKAIALYQRALELDAVYGDGQTIDRGKVYDRIGALRAQ